MNFFWLDANAYAKRYIAEKGSSLVNYFFEFVPLGRMICLFEGAGEIIFVFVRRRNENKITETFFNQIRQHFEEEFTNRSEIEHVFPTEDQITDSWELIEKHSINSTDAIILQCAIDYANDLRMKGHRLILVSSDKRLIRAARNEDMLTFNPETDTQTALNTFINAP